jgi:hypothetical protein
MTTTGLRSMYVNDSDELGKARRRKSTKKCRFGKVKVGRRKGQCLKHKRRRK